MTTSDIVSIDGETRTAFASLPSVGVHRYVEDPYFRIYMFSWAFNDEEVELWEYGQPFPQSLVRHAKRGGRFQAWNAMFERVTFGKQFARQVHIPRMQWSCTMVRSLACGLPGKLEFAAKALRVDQQKDKIGSKAMERLMRPKNWQRLRDGKDTKPLWYTREQYPELYRTTGKYCLQDTRTERAIGKKLPYLPESEQRQYAFDQRVADRGIRIDTELCEAAIKVARVRGAELREEGRKICGFSTTQVQQVRAWVKKQGVDMPNFKAPLVEKQIAVLSKTKESAKKYANVIKILKLRQESGKTSVSKYQTALRCICSDGKAKGQRQFYGAHTGRWAGRLIQLDNLMRPTMPKKMIDDVVGVVRNGESWLVASCYDNVMEAVANSTRSMLIADEGHDLYVGDFKSIESRMLAETSGQQSTNDAWRLSDQGLGPDVYVSNAADLFNITTKQVEQQNSQEWRFWGKTQELTLGYQGGVKPLIGQTEKSSANFRDIYPIVHRNANDDQRSKVQWLWEKMGEGDEKEWKAARYTVERWRKKNFMTVKLWAALQAHSIKAMQNKGSTVRVRYKNPRTGDWHDTGVSFRFDVALNMLFCNLKSGRSIIYPDAELVKSKGFDGELHDELRAYYWHAKFKRYVRYHPYGGFIAENITQAHARDAMAGNFHGLEALKFWLLHTVHDEMITQALIGSSLKSFIKAASRPPWWAPNMPIAVEAWYGHAYKKG